jgi:hypothetical protein
VKSSQVSAIFGRLLPHPAYHRERPRWLDIIQPVIGNKFFAPTEKGVYVLEKGPGMFVGWLCTAAGSGGVFVYDGIPNEDGLFEAIGDTPGQRDGLERAQKTGNYDFNGRIIYSAVPPIMQPWQMNAGVKYGITLELTGNNPGVPLMGAITIGTATWQPHGQRAEKKRG